MTVADRTSSVSGVVWSIATESTTGTALPMFAVSATGRPFVVPSFGVTVTMTSSPLPPLFGADRSNVSVSAVVADVVWRTTPSTVHT